MNEYFDEKQKIEKRWQLTKAFVIGEIIREERRLASMTQEQLAKKTGAKKSFISRIENGHNVIQLSTLYRILEYGLGRKISQIIR